MINLSHIFSWLRCTSLRNGNLRMVYHVLNECLIDRGASPSMVRMECFIDGHLITNILVSYIDLISSA